MNSYIYANEGNTLGRINIETCTTTNPSSSISGYLLNTTSENKILELTRRIELLELKLAKLKELTSIPEIYDVL